MSDFRCQAKTPGRCILPSPLLYHVTSSLALEALAKDGVLLPPVFHNALGIVTHKGVGLPLLDTFLQEFRIDLGEKDKFLWLGSRVDMQQFVEIESKITQLGSRVDEAMAELFFNSERSRLHPQLKEVLEILAKGGKPGENLQLERYVNLFMDRLNSLTGIRDGWFDELREILLGEKVTHHSIEVGIIESVLLATFNLHHHFRNEVSPQESQVVVLEIDSQKMFQSVGNGKLFPFVLSYREPRRDPREIIASPSLSRSSLRRIYAQRPAELGMDIFDSLGVPINSIEDLPSSSRLGTGIIFLPSDPCDPACRERYKEDTMEVLREHLRTGRLAPSWGMELWDPQDPKRSVLRHFGEELLFEDDISERSRFLITLELASQTIKGIFGNYPDFPN